MFDILMAHAGRYTFGYAPDWSEAWVSGTWDIVYDAFYEGLITAEEYNALVDADERARSVKHIGRSVLAGASEAINPDDIHGRCITYKRH